MWQEILKAIPVYFSSMFKFIFGPLGGYAVRLEIITTILATVAGMMTVVFAFSFFGEFLRKRVLSRFFRNKKRFSARSRRFVIIWRKYGIAGVAALTPVLLTPIGGTIVAMSFGAPRNKLLLYMFISAVVWAVIFTVATYKFGKEVFPDYIK